MPVYLFIDANAPVGGISKFVLFHPGNLKAAIKTAQEENLGGQNQRFQVFDAVRIGREPTLCCVERNLGQPESGQQPQLSAQHVQGRQPTGVPQGQPGQPPNSGNVDVRSGFQKLGTEATVGAFDAMYGEGEDGTYSDIVAGPGGGSVEIARNE